MAFPCGDSHQMSSEGHLQTPREEEAVGMMPSGYAAGSTASSPSWATLPPPLHPTQPTGTLAEIWGQARSCHILDSSALRCLQMPSFQGHHPCKSVYHGVNQFKFARSLQSIAEEQGGCHCRACGAWILPVLGMILCTNLRGYSHWSTP